MLFICFYSITASKVKHFQDKYKQMFVFNPQKFHILKKMYKNVHNNCLFIIFILIIHQHCTKNGTPKQ